MICVKYLVHGMNLINDQHGSSRFYHPQSSMNIHHTPSRIATIKNKTRDFPGGAVVKNLLANAGDMGSSPGLGRSHMLRSN